jgi:4-hydroxybenzoate polyprenyltransferase
MSALYSLPFFNFKGVPIFNSLLHFLTGLFHFMLGYYLFSPYNLYGIYIGSFFALIFTAGHLTHESRDFAADKINNIKTNAVFFSQRFTLIASFILFSVADLWLLFLSLQRIVVVLLLIIAFIYLLHLFLFIQIIRSDFSFDNISRYQQKYRMLYAFLGVYIFSIYIFKVYLAM